MWNRLTHIPGSFKHFYKCLANLCAGVPGEWTIGHSEISALGNFSDPWKCEVWEARFVFYHSSLVTLCISCNFFRILLIYFSRLAVRCVEQAVGSTAVLQLSCLFNTIAFVTHYRHPSIISWHDGVSTFPDCLKRPLFHAGANRMIAQGAQPRTRFAESRSWTLQGTRDLNARLDSVRYSLVAAFPKLKFSLFVAFSSIVYSIRDGRFYDP